MRIDIGFILGELSSTPLSNFKDLAPVHNVSEPVHQTEVADMYELVNQTNQTESDDYYQGRLGTEAIPGDLTIRGERTLISADNYTTKVGTDNVRTTYSEITGELTECTRIKNTYNLLAQERTFIIGDDALALKYGGLDPHKSYLDAYEVKDNKLVRDPDKKHVYALVEAQGSYIAGTYKTLYTEEDEKKEIPRVPLFQERLSSDGHFAMNSAKSMRFSKSTLFAHVECEGDTFKPDDSQGQPLHAPAVTPLLRKTTIPADKGEIDVKFNTYTVDDITNGQQSIEELQAFIDFEEDGSIKLRDAWGSYIYLHGGNIQIHAVNNIFMISGRDYIQAAGGSVSCNATKAIHAKSNDADIALFAKNDIQCKANRYNIETDYFYVRGNTKAYIDSPVIHINDSTKTVGYINIGHENTQLTLSATQTNILSKSALTMVTSVGGFVIDAGGTITAHGNMQLSGNLTLTPAKTTIKVNGNHFSDLCELPGSIFITDGGLYSAHIIGACAGILTDYVMANTVASDTGQLGKVVDYTLEPVQRMVSKCKNKQNRKIKITKPEVAEKDLLTFQFVHQSQSCTYTAEACELDGTASFSVTSNAEHFSYPGKLFWTENGVQTITIDPDTEEQSKNYSGFNYYGFNIHNTTNRKG
jgi:hypothetical protein